MKLLTKTLLYIATLSLFLFFAMGIGFYQVLKKMSINELNREILEMRLGVEKNLPLILENELRDLPGIDTIAINITSDTSQVRSEFRDTLIFDSSLHQFRNFHSYSFIAKDKDINYTIKLYKSTTPTDKLVERVTLMMTLMLIFFLAGIFILNRFIFSNLWKDFFDALGKIKKFSVESGSIAFQESDIQEFRELNAVLENITERLSRDYKELKEYTDHTTHELQTPLAIIKSRAELLLQSDNLRQSDIELIRDIYKNADHLSRLNSTLAMITRIENDQYNEKSNVNINVLVNSHLEMLHELIGLRNITIMNTMSSDEIIVTLDKGLADILIINLLKNAITHNVDGGMIRIETSDRTMIIRNTGNKNFAPPEKLFERFYRGSKKTDSFGLGLSLVKKICDYYGFRIKYHFEKDVHSFIINFQPQKHA